MRRTPSATALPRRRERRKDIANAVNKEDSELQSKHSEGAEAVQKGVDWTCSGCLSGTDSADRLDTDSGRGCCQRPWGAGARQGA